MIINVEFQIKTKLFQGLHSSNTYDEILVEEGNLIGAIEVVRTIMDCHLENAGEFEKEELKVFNEVKMLLS